MHATVTVDMHAQTASSEAKMNVALDMKGDNIYLLSNLLPLLNHTGFKILHPELYLS